MKTKTSIIFLFVAVYFIVTGPAKSFGQTGQFSKGQSDYSFGIGFVSTITNALESEGFNVQTATPPLSFTADFATGDNFSLGGYIGIAKDNLSYTDYFAGTTIHGSISHLILGIRGLYHFELSPAFDTYGGLMLGYNAFTAHIESRPVNISGLTYRLLTGGRYHFSEGFSAFAELGYGVSLLNLGITLTSRPHHLAAHDHGAAQRTPDIKDDTEEDTDNGTNEDGTEKNKQKDTKQVDE